MATLSLRCHFIQYWVFYNSFCTKLVVDFVAIIFDASIFFHHLYEFL